MQDFRDRLKIEYKELEDRLEKLSAFLETETFYSLSEEEKNDLKTQLNGMTIYHAALKSRLTRYNLI